MNNLGSESGSAHGPDEGGAGGLSIPPAPQSAVVAELLDAPLRLSRAVAEIAAAAGAEPRPAASGREVISLMIGERGQLFSVTLADGSKVIPVELDELPQTVRRMPNRALTGAELLEYYRRRCALPRGPLAPGLLVADRAVRAEGEPATLIFRRVGR